MTQDKENWQYILGVMYPKEPKKKKQKTKENNFSNHRIGGSIDTPMTMAAVFQNKAN